MADRTRPQRQPDSSGRAATRSSSAGSAPRSREEMRSGGLGKCARQAVPWNRVVDVDGRETRPLELFAVIGKREANLLVAASPAFSRRTLSEEDRPSVRGNRKDERSGTAVRQRPVSGALRRQARREPVEQGEALRHQRSDPNSERRRRSSRSTAASPATRPRRAAAGAHRPAASPGTRRSIPPSRPAEASSTSRSPCCARRRRRRAAYRTRSAESSPRSPEKRPRRA